MTEEGKVSDEKKYPWIKSIFGRKKKNRSAEGVYAGPEHFEKDSEAKCVYAGPEYFGKNDAAMEEVYAGPEFFERDPDLSEEPEDAAPAPGGSDEGKMPIFDGVPVEPPKFPQMMCVYAGPEYFSGQQTCVGAPAPEGVDLSNLPQWSPEAIYPGDEKEEKPEDVKDDV